MAARPEYVRIEQQAESYTLGESGFWPKADIGCCLHMSAFGGKADIMMKRLYVRYDQSGHSKLLEGATTSSWMSIPSSSRQTHSSAFFSSRMWNIVSDDGPSRTRHEQRQHV
jgi:hypothetical protein